MGRCGPLWQSGHLNLPWEEAKWEARPKPLILGLGFHVRWRHDRYTHQILGRAGERLAATPGNSKAPKLCVGPPEAFWIGQ